MVPPYLDSLVRSPVYPSATGTNVASPGESTWTRISRIVRKLDEDKIKDCKEDIDTILVFAGLFATVMTTFIVESYKTLQQDPMMPIVSLLQQIAAQTGSFMVAGGFINSTLPPVSVSTVADFRPTTNAKRVNILWFASLVLSLATASLGIIVKQWLREYLAGEYTSAQARLRVRHFRHPQLSAWKVFEIAAILPLLLQLSLALFLLGLCFFTADIHNSIGHTTVPLVAAWAFLFGAVTWLPAAVPSCPYKTSFLKDALNMSRRQWCKIFSYWFSIILPRLSSKFHVFKLFTEQYIWSLLYEDEERAVRNDKQDMDILLAVDAIQADDQLLNDVMWEALQQVDLAPEELANFLFATIGHRAQCDVPAAISRSFLNLKSLPKSTYAVIMDMVAGLVARQIQRLPSAFDERTEGICDEWLEHGICVLLSNSKFPHSEMVNRVLHMCLSEDRHHLISYFIHSRVNIHDDPLDVFPSILQRLSGALMLIEDPKEFLVVMQRLFQPHLSLPSPRDESESQPVAADRDDQRHDNDDADEDDDTYFQVPPNCRSFVVEQFVARLDNTVDCGVWTSSHQVLFKRSLRLALATTGDSAHAAYIRYRVLSIAERLLKSPALDQTVNAVCEIALGMGKSSSDIRELAQYIYLKVFLFSNRDDRSLLLSKFVSFEEARLQAHYHPYAMGSSELTPLATDPLASCHLQLRLIRYTKQSDGEHNRHQKLEYLWKTIFGLLLPRIRLALMWGRAEHQTMAAECLQLIDLIQPWAADGQDDWSTAPVLAVKSSLFSDEFVQALADFLPFPIPVFTWRLRRLKLAETALARSGEVVVKVRRKAKGGAFEPVPIAVLAVDGTQDEQEGQPEPDGQDRFAILMNIMKQYIEEKTQPNESEVAQSSGSQHQAPAAQFPSMEAAPERMPAGPSELSSMQVEEGEEEWDALEESVSAAHEDELIRTPVLATLYSAFHSSPRLPQRPLSMREFPKTSLAEDYGTEPGSPQTSVSSEEATPTAARFGDDMASTPILATLMSRVGVSVEGQLYVRADDRGNTEPVDPLLASILQALALLDEEVERGSTRDASFPLDVAQQLSEDSDLYTGLTSSSPLVGPLDWLENTLSESQFLSGPLEPLDLPPELSVDRIEVSGDMLSALPVTDPFDVFAPSPRLNDRLSSEVRILFPTETIALDVDIVDGVVPETALFEPSPRAHVENRFEAESPPDTAATATRPLRHGLSYDTPLVTRSSPPARSRRRSSSWSYTDSLPSTERDRDKPPVARQVSLPPPLGDPQPEQDDSDHEARSETGDGLPILTIPGQRDMRLHSESVNNS